MENDGIEKEKLKGKNRVKKIEQERLSKMEWKKKK